MRFVFKIWPGGAFSSESGGSMQASRHFYLCGLTTVESYTQNDFAGWSFRKFPQNSWKVLHENPTNDSWTKKPIRMGSSGMAMAYAMIVKGYTQQKAPTSSWQVAGKCW